MYFRGLSTKKLSSYFVPFLAAGVLLSVAGPWSDLHAEATDVVINELLYHPDPDNTGGEFIELFNRGDTSVDLSGWKLGEAVTYEFPAGTMIDPGAFLVVAREPEEARAFYQNEAIIGPWDGRLNNAGERLLLKDAGDAEIDVVPYDDTAPWPLEADGGGSSLELTDPANDNSQSASWALGQPFSVGQENAPVDSGAGDILITEIMYKPRRTEPRQKFDRVNQGPYVEEADDEFGEFIELYNRIDEVVDLSGWAFTEGVEYEFPEGTELAPGQYLVVAGAPDMLKTRQGIENVVGPFSGVLRNGGERLTLRDSDGGLVNTVRFNDKPPWPVAPDQFGVSLEVITPLEDNATAANWRSSEDAFPPPKPILDAEAPVGDDWQLMETTGSARSRTLVLAFLVAGPGEWLLDDVEVRVIAGGENLMENGSFDASIEGWSLRGNHETSVWTGDDGHDAPGALRLIATGAGTVSNSVRIRTTVSVGVPLVVRGWIKHVTGFPTAQVRAVGGGGGLMTSVSKSTFNLHDDWSDTDNPNGLWEYRDAAGELITARSENWLAGDLGPQQTAWANGDGGVGWAKSVGNAPTLDFPAGWVGGQGPAQLWWTSPGLGEVTFSGGVYLARHGDVNQMWEIRTKDRMLTTGELVAGQTDVSSGNPMSLESGNGGAGALTAIVDKGDAIRFVVGANPDGEGTFSTGELVAFDIDVKFRGGQEAEPPVSGAIGMASPGRQNSQSADALPPFVDDLEHFPSQPTSSEDVMVSVKVSSVATIKSVALGLEALNGANRETLEPVPMFDDGAHNDGEAGDGIYGAQVPARESQTLVHYWVRVEDVAGRVTSFPYESDPAPTAAYFHYDNEIESGNTLYFLFMDRQTLTQLSRNPRDDAFLNCSLVIDDRRVGKEEGPIAYAHIGARRRGRNSRMNSRHQWKFKFNRDHLYDGNRTVDTMLSIPLVQRLGFMVFDVAGTDNLESEVIGLYLNGRFWEPYVAFEVPNATWVRKHDLGGDTEVYKARSSETSRRALTSDYYANDIQTDFQFWAAWNKYMRPFESPDEIREFVRVFNQLSMEELHAWIDENMEFDRFMARYGVNLMLNIDDFGSHNHYMFRPEGQGWTWLGYDFDSLGRLISGNLYITYLDGRMGNQDWQRSKVFQRISTSKTLRRLHFLNLRKMMNSYFTIDNLEPILNAEQHRVRHTPKLRRDAARHVLTQARNQIRNYTSNLARERLPGEEVVPVIDPPGGSFGVPVTVTLTAPEEWQVVYTVDGGDPRLVGSPLLYSGPITVTETSTIRAASLGIRNGEPDFRFGNWTDLAEADFEMDTGAAPLFVRGDFNLDRRLTATDVVQLLRHLFSNGESQCRIAGDANNDDNLNIADAIFLVDFLFRHGNTPAAPFPSPGLDPDGASPLGCAQGIDRE